MLNKIKKSNDGFTIIEVLIVLAIAGLIMVVVFIAVPNLQRNARNQKVDTEANALLTAYSEVSAQKGGLVLDATSGAGVYAAANLETTKSTIQTATWATGAGANATANDVKVATFRTNAKCQSDTSANAVAGSSPRQVALLFTEETAGGFVQQCKNA